MHASYGRGVWLQLDVAYPPPATRRSTADGVDLRGRVPAVLLNWVRSHDGAWSSTTVLAPGASPSSSCSYPLRHSHPATTRRRPREITALDREPIGSLRRLRLRPAPGRVAPVLSTVLLAVVLAGAAPGTRAIRAIRQRAR